MATETQAISKYNGEVQITFYPNSHMYKIGGQSVMSVSRICEIVDKSAGLIIWAIRLARDFLQKLPVQQRTDEALEEAIKQHSIKKQEAADIGHYVHSYAEAYIAGNTLEEMDKDLLSEEDMKRAKNGIIAFLQWVNENNIQWEASEQMVYSKKYNYVGTFDAIAIINGKRYLIDFKTSKGLYRLEHGMQTAAYLKAHQEEHGTHFDWRIILHFNKETGEFGYHELQELDEDFECFLAAQKLAERKKKTEKY